jgi:PAS domain S-box-containing protein
MISKGKDHLKRKAESHPVEARKQPNQPAQSVFGGPQENGAISGENENRFHILFETMTQGVVYQASDGRITLANPAAQRILGLSLDQMQGRTSMDPLWQATRDDGSDFPGEEHPAMIALRTGKPVRDVVMGIYHPALDRQRWIQVNAIPQFRPGETQPFEVYTSFTDITELIQAREALKHSEANLNRAQAVAHVGSWHLDIRTNLLEWSDETYRMFRISQGTPLDFDAFFASIYPDDRPGVGQAWQAFLAGAPYDIEHRIIAGGEVRWMHERAELIFDEHHNVLQAVGTVQDISDRKQVEAGLLEAEQRFRQLADNLEEVFWIYDHLQQRIVYISPAYEMISGYPCQSLYDNPRLYIDSILPDDRRIVKSLLKRQAAGERTESEYRILHSDGDIRWIWDRTFPVNDATGQVVRTLGLSSNVTDRKYATEVILANEEKYRSLVESSDAIIAMVDSEGRFRYVNDIALQEFGDHYSDFAGKTMQDLFPSPVSGQQLDNVREVIRQNKGQTFESPVIIGGQTRWYRTSIQPIRDKSGRSSMAMVNAADITEHKRAEEKLRRWFELESLVAGISTRFISLPYETAEDEILGLLAGIGQFAGVEYSFIILLDEDRRSFSSIYQWIMDGVESSQINMQALDSNDLAWTVNKILNNETVAIRCLDDLPAQAHIERQWFESLHVSGTAWTPLISDHGPLGIIGLASRDDERDWSGEDIALLKLVGEIISSSLSRWRAEAEVRELNRSLERRVAEQTAEVQDLYDNAPCGYHSLDIEGRYAYVNDTELIWLGYRRDEILQRKFIDFISEKSRDVFLQNFETFKRIGWVKGLEFEMVRRDGSILPVLLDATVIYNQNGEYVMSRSSIFDITERKKVEEALLVSQAQLQEFLDTASDLIQIVDMKGNYLYVNRSWCHTLGYTREEASRLILSDVLHPDYRQALPALLGKQLEPGQTQHIETVLATFSGAPVVVEGSFNLQVENGRAVATRGIFRDVTLRRQAEAALRQSRDELSAANAALEKAARMKDEFLASMSHELRTPLTGILGLSEALQMQTYGSLNEKQLRALNMIESSGRHLLDLINDILDLSKIEAGKLDLKIQLCSLAEVCQASLQLTKGIAQQKRHRVNFSMEPPGISIRADARRLKQMLVNLLSNAVKFTPEGGDIGLEVCGIRTENVLKITVWDKGIGIQSEDLQRLFKPFVQLDSSLARQATGTGLGLSLVHRLTELHGGRMEVESSPGQGSRFTIVLPWSEEVIQPSPTIRPEIFRFERELNFDRAGAMESPQILSPLIVLADDNEINLGLISDYLETHRYRVATARNGNEALQTTLELKPDLVIMDIQMPLLDGLEAIRRIRGMLDPHIAKIPVIALTALAMPGDRDRCLAAGANFYMSKPIQLSELGVIVHELLNETHDG